MQVRELYNRHIGQEMYILGPGPSARVFPMKLLEGKLTMALKRAWQYFPCTYSISSHGEVWEEYQQCLEKGLIHDTTWILKSKGRIAPQDTRYYTFDAEPRKGSDPRYIKPRRDNYLYFAGGIQNTAMCLALRMGVKAIYLIGVDLCSLDGEHHGHHQQVCWYGKGEADIYSDTYLRYAQHVRRTLQRDYHIPVVSLTPFLGLNRVEDDYLLLKRELNLPHLPTVRDSFKQRMRAKGANRIERIETRKSASAQDAVAIAAEAPEAPPAPPDEPAMTKKKKRSLKMIQQPVKQQVRTVKQRIRQRQIPDEEEACAASTDSEATTQS